MLLNNNDNQYNRLLKHKINQTTTNDKLQKELQRRGYETNSIVEDFECFICQKSIGKTSAEELKKPKQLHDTCTENLIYPRMRTMGKNRNTWQSIFRQGKCESSLFSELIHRNENFTKDSFQKELIRRFNEHLCEL